MSTISRICPRTLGRAQSLCRGFSNRNIPVHRHSARDHQRVDLVPWNDFFSPSSILPASFSSRFRDIEKMMRDMENVLEHKYLSFPARGEDSEVCEWDPPPSPEFTSARPVYWTVYRYMISVQNMLNAYLRLCHEINVIFWLAESREMRSSADAQKRCFPIFYTSIYRKVNDPGRLFSLGKNHKASQVAVEYR